MGQEFQTTKAPADAAASAATMSSPDWRGQYPTTEISVSADSTYHPLSVVHYATAAERAPAHIRSDRGAFAAWRLTEDPEIRTRVDSTGAWVLPPEQALLCFERFALTIRPNEGYRLLEKVALGVASADGCAELMRRFPVNPYFQTIAAYDPRWMERLYADEYTFYLLRREDRATFVNPHLAPDPIGVLLHQGYTLTTWAREGDVVLYCSKSPDNPYVATEHWGIVHGNGVISKNTAGNIALHNLAAGGFPDQSVLIFTKPLDTSRPVPDLCGIKDWVLRRGAVVSRSAEEANDKVLEKQRRVRELEDGLLTQTLFNH